jgi:hypothetical protein
MENSVLKFKESILSMSKINEPRDWVKIEDEESIIIIGTIGTDNQNSILISRDSFKFEILSDGEYLESDSIGVIYIMTFREYRRFILDNGMYLEDVPFDGFIIPDFKGVLRVGYRKGGDILGFDPLGDYFINQVSNKYKPLVIIPDGFKALKLNPDLSLPHREIREWKISNLISRYSKN